MTFNKIELPGRFEFFEQESSPLNDTEDFFAKSVYEAFFKFKNHLNLSRKLQFLEDPFKFENNETSLNIAAKTEQIFKIIFTPVQVGNNNFSLILEKIAKGPRVALLNRNLKVIKATEKINSQVTGLPTTMKLGQKAEIIFLFANVGNQPVSGINIEVKQIEA